MNPAPKQVTVIPTARQVSLVRFAPQGEQLFAAGRDGKIHRWSLTAQDDPPADALKPNSKSDPPAAIAYPELEPLSGHDGWVTQLAFHPQQREMYSADSWGRLICWSLTDAAPQQRWNIPSAHDGWLRQLAVSADGTQLATVGKDQMCRIWSTSDGKPLRELARQPDDLLAVQFHPEGTSLVTGDLKGIVRQWEFATGTMQREFEAKIMYLLHWIQEVGGVRVLAFDGPGKILAVAGAQPTTGGFVQAIPLVKFFDWAAGKELQTLKLGENNLGYVHDLAWHAEGYWLGVCSGQPGQGSFFLHRMGEEKPFFTQTLPNCHSVAVDPQGKRCAVVSNAGTFGQQRSMAREGIYPGNTSPIHVFQLGT